MTDLRAIEIPALIPAVPPEWAEVFGEDRFGIFAEFSVGVPFVFRWIPPGRFLMGSPEGEHGRYGDEGPQHEVTISRGFWMGETPVTQAQWSWVSDWKNPSQFKGVDRPVEQVTWENCRDFAGALNRTLFGAFPSQSPGAMRFRLPTEAEWEYGCRGVAGRGSAFNDGSPCTEPAGKDPALDRLGWFGGNSGNETHEVKGKKPNGWGLYDLHGNVWEWCLDGRRDYTAEPQVDPLGPTEESASRAMRGGSWYSQARFCRSACRDANLPGDRWSNQGFRLVAGQEPRAAEPPGAVRRKGGGRAG